ncbi:hypothetical protein ALI144C_34940 [Actinosynnema sp. ALI-1.44]|nr:hypothetical protein ALI144C_34940 [Actinosynnema sp. ALI-1.44]
MSCVVLVLAGCATSEVGRPVAPRAVSTTESSAANRHGAPSVSNPLDATRQLSRPCSALTESQLQSLRLPTSGIPDTDSAIARNAGPSCFWRNGTELSRVAISFMTGNKNGLADNYRAHAEDSRGYWIETTVDGYPAVFQDNTDNRKTGNCALLVGISDTLAVLVDEQDQLGEQSCARAKHIAALMITTVRAGG